MKLSVLIPSRGRPVELLRVIAETDANVINTDDTTISVALDDDDGSNPEVPSARCKLVWHIGEREDSLGAKYNRAAKFAPAQTYVMGADDNIFKTKGWDERIREKLNEFNASFGFVYFGRLDGTLPTNMAVPHRLLEHQGFLFPDLWPFWYHDTWTDEIAHFSGRILWADIEVEEIHGRGKSRGIRDVPFWTNLFEGTREMRRKLGIELSREHNPGWLQTQLLQRHEILTTYFMMRMERLRNPATAVQFERRMSFDAPEDERYRRIKARAEALMAEAAGKAA